MDGASGLKTAHRGEELTKKKSNLEKVLGDPFEWDAWTVTISVCMQRVLVDVKEGRLATPVEILFTSVTDEPLVHLRLKALETDALEHLQSDKSKWQNPEIFPVTVNICDAAGVPQEWKVDPRPTRLN